MLWMVLDCCGNTIYFKIEPVDISPVFFIGKIEFDIPVFQGLVTVGGFVIFICIGPQVKPNEP